MLQTLSSKCNVPWRNNTPGASASTIWAVAHVYHLYRALQPSLPAHGQPGITLGFSLNRRREE